MNPINMIKSEMIILIAPKIRRKANLAAARERIRRTIPKSNMARPCKIVPTTCNKA